MHLQKNQQLEAVSSVSAQEGNPGIPLLRGGGVSVLLWPEAQLHHQGGHMEATQKMDFTHNHASVLSYLCTSDNLAYKIQVQTIASYQGVKGI